MNPAQAALLADLSWQEHVFLIGAFAESAVLGSKVSNEASDVDLLVDKELWPSVRHALATIGLTAFSPKVTGPAGEALALESIDRAVPVEVWLAERDALMLPGITDRGVPAYFKLQLPQDTFHAPRSSLNGLSVQTVSALALALLRATSARTRGSLQQRAKDMEMVRCLAEQCLPGRSPDDWVPQLTLLSLAP